MLMILLVFGTAAFCPPSSVSAQEDAFAGRTITGTAYFPSGRRPGRTLPFRLIVNRLSTDDEISQLNSALQSGGEDELMRRLEAQIRI